MTTRYLGDSTNTKKFNMGGTNKNARNLTNTRKVGASTHKEEKDKEEEERKIFQYRIPTDLRKKENPPQQNVKEKEKEEKKKEGANQEESKSVPVSTFTHVNATTTEHKEEDHSGTFNESVDDDVRRREQEIRDRKRETTERELETKVYIALSETPTTIMYFTPSLKYFKDKGEVEEEKKKDEFYKAYKEKRKNKESFTNHGAQTINKFRRNQVVTTSSLKDQETDNQMSERVNALSWNIEDATNELKNKKDDEGKIFQKKLDRKIKRELKEKIKISDSMANPEESYSIHKSQMSETSYSIMDTIISHSLQSSRKPKPRMFTSSIVKESDDRSMQDKSKQMGQSSPNSSVIKDAKSNSETGKQPQSQVSGKPIKQDLNMELPNSIINPLRYVERLLSQNQFHFRQIAYKNYPISLNEFTAKKDIRSNSIAGFELVSSDNNDENQNAQDEMFKKEIELVSNTSEKPDMKFLFRFSGHRILKESNSKYIVHSLDWNPYNKDLLAAGYGDPDIDSKKEGLLCFWTLKNPLHPERVIHTPRGITSCNFSTKNPYYIVASDYAGEIMIYDLRVNGNRPIADSTDLKDKHTDTVWEAKWIEKPNDKNELIVSISSDGKVKEWSLKKGLEVTDLMRMKKNIAFPDKTLSPFAKYEKPKDNSKESLVFRDANGLSFDFPKNDTTIYYISLEECTLHRCRISYKDQYTDTYYGHQGPAYKVRCNPYDPNVLLSCSYDWTVKIWNSKQMYPVLNCQSMKLSHQVNDIEWSPFTSTIFGSVADDGRIEIWDLAQQTIDPIILWKPDEPSKINVPRKSIKFSKSSQVFATGDADFDIDIFRLYNLKHVEVSDEDQRRRLQHVLSQNSELGMKSN